MPQSEVQSKPLIVTKVTSHSISIKWDPATTDKPETLHYVVFLKELINFIAPWYSMSKVEGLYHFTYTDLKPNTRYGVYVGAFYGDTLVAVYPNDNDGMIVRTHEPDNEAPKVLDRMIDITGLSHDSISIKWIRVTDNVTPVDKILYEVWLKEADAPKEYWRKYHEGTGIDSYTFTGLKAATKYDFFVLAFDEDENVFRYPFDDLCMNAKTNNFNEVDSVAPTVKNKNLRIIDITPDGFSIQWDSALDNVTPANRIRYEVWIKKSETPSDPWHKYQELTGITSYTFTGLEADTEYSIYVRAFDECGNYVQYPLYNGCWTVRTKFLDKEAPTVKNWAIVVNDLTYDSISIQWEKATDNATSDDKIRYEVWFKKTDSSDPWRKHVDQKGVNSCTFTGLAMWTDYSFYVRAYDESGNYIQYPRAHGWMTVRTPTSDKQAPTVGSRTLTFTNVKKDAFTVSWIAAKDNVTAASKIRYQVYVFIEGSWVEKCNSCGITSCTVTGLKPDTQYFVYVKALDESGNVLRYPSDNYSSTVKTKPAYVNKLSFTILQNATVLKGTDTVSLKLIFNAIQLDAKGKVSARQAFPWSRKWASNTPVATAIQLPEKWYFDNNVHVIVKSRRGSKAGLNTWKTCSEGDLPLSGDTLKIKLTGNYYDYNVKYTQV